jgi:uncharacterized protein YjbI with pentapeptide repeats
MKANEVLKRYAAGERDFRRVNLQGQSFKGKDLSGADFSEADIRGADFTHAILKDASFSHAKAGLQSSWAIVLVIVSLLLSALSGFASACAGAAGPITFYSENPWNITGEIVLITLLVFFIVTIRQGLVAALGALSATAIGVAAVAAFLAWIEAVAVKRAAFLGIIWIVGTAVAKAVAGAGAVIVTGGVIVAVAAAVAVAESVAGSGSVAIAAALVGVVTGAWVVAVGKAGVVAVTWAMAVAVVGVGISGYVSWRTLAGDEKHAFLRAIAIAFAAIGGTSFRKANLTNANFTQATLKSTDFRGAILTRTRWYQAKKLDRIRPGATYLRNAQVRQWLITGQGQDKNFDRQDLRGVNLQGANLADASFIGADLSYANLQDADLSRAKLVQTQLDETDLTGATLSGAYIEDWGITSHTKLQGVRCEYVFMRLPTKEDPDPCRKPDNKREVFKDGDFTDFISPIVDTLDLYHNQGVDPRAIAISFKQLSENHPHAELDIVAMEKRGKDKFLLRAKTAPHAERSSLSAEYFSTYNQVKSLPENHVQILLAAKDSHIQSLENTIINFINAFDRPTIYNLPQAQFGGGFAGTKGTQSGGTFYDDFANPNLSQAATEIQQLLQQLAATNPIAKNLMSMIEKSREK